MIMHIYAQHLHMVYYTKGLVQEKIIRKDNVLDGQDAQKIDSSSTQSQKETLHLLSYKYEECIARPTGEKVLSECVVVPTCGKVLSECIAPTGPEECIAPTTGEKVLAGAPGAETRAFEDTHRTVAPHQALGFSLLQFIGLG